MFHYVYLLAGKNNRLYVGMSADLRKRLAEHNRGKNFSTKPHGPWQLIHYEAYLNELDAHEREAALKNYGAGLGQLRRRIKRSLESAG